MMLNDRGDLEKIEAMINELSAIRQNVLAKDRSALRAYYSVSDIARHYLRLRRIREAEMPNMFQDPAWDILLDLFAAAMEGKSISVSSACIASAAPPTTALRHIEKLNRAGLLYRHGAPDDRRRIFVSITTRGEEMVRNFLNGLTATTEAFSGCS
jgi:hypothetical protein